MNKTTLAIAATITLVFASPALAGHPPVGGSSTGGATSVPEPTDAVLLLMGAAGVVIGRRLHARKKKD
jgi:hypothetical protein